MYHLGDNASLALLARLLAWSLVGVSFLNSFVKKRGERDPQGKQEANSVFLTLLLQNGELLPFYLLPSPFSLLLYIYPLFTLFIILF